MKQDIQGVFKERARLLCQERKLAEKSGLTVSVLSFYLADEKYALEAEYIESVIALKRFTDLPCTPDYILGVINVQGKILAVIDIKKLFKLPEKGITNLNRVIILSYKGIEFGVLTDEIIGREEVPLSEIQKKLPNIGGIKSDLVRGVSKDRVIIINTRELFQDARITINEEI